MPRLTNSVPKYRKHRASGQAVVTLNGRDNYLGPHGSKASGIEYDRLISEWLACNRNPFVSGSSSLTVSKLIARYWGFAQGFYRKNGQPTNEISALKSALRPLRELYDRTSAVAFGPLALESVMNLMVLQWRWLTGTTQAAIRCYNEPSDCDTTCS